MAVLSTRTREHNEPPLLRTAILPPANEDFAGGDGLALSNDGTMLAFTVLALPLTSQADDGKPTRKAAKAPGFKGDPKALIDDIVRQQKLPLKIIVKTVGCQPEELEAQLFGRADLIISADTPEDAILDKLAATFDLRGRP